MATRGEDPVSSCRYVCVKRNRQCSSFAQVRLTILKNNNLARGSISNVNVNKAIWAVCDPQPSVNLSHGFETRERQPASDRGYAKIQQC